MLDSIAETIYVLGLVFAAGGFYASAARLKKDVNGVGARVKAMETKSNDRHNRLCVALMSLAKTPEEKSDLMRVLGDS
jgi:hypothetical protein